jgi:hypothetical protein
LGRLATRALPLGGSLAAHALIVVALVGALVFTAGQESFAESLASGDGLSARLTLPAKQFFNSVVARWAVAYSLGIFLAGFTGARVALLFALVQAAVQLLSASALTGLSFSAAQPLGARIAAEAHLSLCECARVAFALMAHAFALMLPTVECLLAKLLT